MRAAPSAPADRPALLRSLRRRLRRALPLAGDPARTGPDRPPGPLDVIVPVYGAAAALDRCLRSLIAHTDLTHHRLVLVLDGPQAADVEALVAGARQEIAGDGPDIAASGQVIAGAGGGVLPGEGAGSSPADGGPAATAGLAVLALPRRGGFVEAVNLGMAASDRDVVLLNSDTRVTAGWLEKLRRAAVSAPEIATVTPFSNSATLCSLPRFLESNALPAGWDVDAFGRLVEERSTAAYPRLPTGVGVCLYIKRKALAALGLFDRESFGLGYGEESEFCMRALKAGYAHVLDDATFIYHEGHRSFGASRRVRVAAAHRRLARLHPEYLPTVGRFIALDPLRPLRERVLAALAPPRPAAAPRPGAPARVLHIVHGWPPWNHAGTELYAAWLARRQAAWREVTVLARIGDPARLLGDALELLDGGARVRLLVRNFDERDPRSRNALASRPVERELARLLDETRPQLVHVHHLAGHAASLPRLVRRRGIPLVYQVQDWWTPCARANLFDRDRHLCSGPGAAKCAACLPLTGLPPRRLLNLLLHRYRAAATRDALRGAAAYVMGSRFIRDSYLALGLLRPEDPIHVLPYGVELADAPGAAPGAAAGSPSALPPRSARQAGAPLRCGFIGSLLPHKGAHVAVAAFAGMDPRRATLRLWGDPTIAPAYTRELHELGARLAPAPSGGAAPGDAPAAANGPPGSADPAATAATVTLAGRFDEAEQAAIFAALDVLIVPSLGLESFGLVAREAMHHGVPVLASRRGALLEIFDAVVPGDRAGDAPGDTPGDRAGDAPGAGAFFTAGDPADLRRWLDRLIDDPALLRRWIAALPAVKSAAEHAEEIEEVYRRVLAPPGPSRPQGGR